MNNAKILIVDDDTNICELLRLYIEKEGYTTVIANDGEEAVSLFEKEKPSLVLLDIMLPKLDGWQVCREIRKTSECPIIMLTAKGEVCRKIRQSSDVPIIMLSAKGETFDRILGLELGADDYVVKPFEAKEVVARIRAVLRRSGANEDEKVKEVVYDKLVVNLTNYELKVDGKVIDTPPKELELLYHLASHPNKVFTRDQLLYQVWGFDYYYGDSRTIDVHIKRIREKIEGVSDKWELRTIWRVGYRFDTKE